jgi:hypothetical protein
MCAVRKSGLINSIRYPNPYACRFIPPFCFVSSSEAIHSHLCSRTVSSAHQCRPLCTSVQAYKTQFTARYHKLGRSQWSRRLRHRSSAKRLLGSWVRTPPGGAWMFVSCTVFVLSGRGLCDGPIPRPEESYRLVCV